MAPATSLAGVRSRLGSPDVSLDRLAIGTTALTYALVLLGIWTAVAGYGLTCDARWPFCDGAVFGLFPANFGSFVEWFHRLVAMVTGFAIIGTAAVSWLAGASLRVRATFTAALVLTPIQVWLGALTVTRYEELILASHFGAALVILTLLVAGTAWTVRPDAPAAGLAGSAALVLALALAFTPGVLVAAHSVGLHLTYYALALAGYVGLLVLALARTGPGSLPVRGPAGAGALAVGVGMTVGRVRLDPTGQLIVLVCLVAAAVLAAAAAWTGR